jgi:Ca-activated chloride channel family protein
MDHIYVPLLLMLGFAGAAEPQTQEPQVPDPFRISVDVNLVVLQATVRDNKGRFASDLGEQDFEVFEDGVRQSIRLFRHEDIPVTAGLVVDHSGSMRQKIVEVTAGARTFVKSSSPEDQMFVVNFNEKVSLGLPESIQFTDRPEDLTRAIYNAPTAGMTALYDALFVAHERLQAGSRDRKVLIVISDGGDNASGHRLTEVLKMAERSSAVVYTIGIFDDGEPDANPSVLRRLAQATGGEAFFPRELTDVVAICDGIAHDIRQQYTLGYVSSNTTQSGRYRAIRVVARAAGRGKLSVRARSGYIPGGESGPQNDAVK